MTTPHHVKDNPKLAEVVRLMSSFAFKGAADVRLLVERICRKLEPGDYASEVLACYYWVCANIRYMRDPYDTEFVKDPQRVVETGAGDCDDIAVLLAAMMLALGNRVAFAIASFTTPPSPTHVFVVVYGPKGEKIVLDPVANSATSQMVGRITHMMVVPIDYAGAKDVYSPRRAMGDDTDGVQSTANVAERTFSVFSYGPRKYTYYTGMAALPSSGWFRVPKGKHASPEVLAAQLPAGVREVGSGNEAVGIVATRTPGLGSDVAPPKNGLSLNLSRGAMLLIGAVAGYLFGKGK